MNINFEAKYVECTEAMDGELLQVTFDTVELENEDDRKTPYVLIGQCFEIPGPPSIEWHDGADFAGGVLQAITIGQNSVNILAKPDVQFEITYSISDKLYTQLAENLRAIFPETTITNL